jgi:type IV secretory pathway VirJ component
VLIGYSQGADVLPFILQHLGEPARKSLAATVALSLSTTATFEFHVSNWMGALGAAALGLTLPVLRLGSNNRQAASSLPVSADSIGCPDLVPVPG